MRIRYPLFLLLVVAGIVIFSTGCQRPEGPSLVSVSDSPPESGSDGQGSSSDRQTSQMPVPDPTPEVTVEDVVEQLFITNSGYATVNTDVPYLLLYRSPDSEDFRGQGLTNPGPFEGLRVIETTGRTTDEFIEIVVPVKPNGTTAWVFADEVSTYESNVLIVIDLSDRKAFLYEGERLLFEAPVAIGTEKTPTPVVDTIVDSIWVRGDSATDLAPLYGDLLFGLNQHSEVLDFFGGRRPALAIHGTDEPQFIGTEVSNGCIRMHPADIKLFSQYVSLGTRVSIIP